jgi:hypothetical protein
MDVQKYDLYWVAREWIETGDSGLVDWGCVTEWDRIDDAVKKYDATRVFVDNSYPERQLEVYSESVRRGYVPTYGRDNESMPFKRRAVDPFEGTSQAGDAGKIATYTFRPNLFKALLQDMMKGESPQKWHVYQNPEVEYVRQVLSEERVDGVFKPKRGHPNNHLWDCEVLQVLAAAAIGLYKNPYE